MSKFIAIAFSAAIAGFCGAANAGSKKADPAVIYMSLDANKDGGVSLEEVLAPSEARFKKMDANGDGAITVEEARTVYEKVVSPDAAKKLKEAGIDDLAVIAVKGLDKDGDGRVALAEFQQPGRDTFKKVDANGDGAATKEEVVVFFEKLKPGAK